MTIWVLESSSCNMLAEYQEDFVLIFLLASCQIRKIADCTCTGNVGNVFPATVVVKLFRHSSRHVRHARVVMHAGSLNSGFLWRRRAGKRFRHYRRMRNPHLFVTGRRPIETVPRWISYASEIVHNWQSSAWIKITFQMSTWRGPKATCR